jgi:hypothetical protein
MTLTAAQIDEVERCIHFSIFKGDEVPVSGRALVSLIAMARASIVYAEALQKIGDYETLDGDKYNSYAEGWEGVAEFARQALTTADGIGK